MLSSSPRALITFTMCRCIGALLDAPAAAHAGIHAVVVGGEVNQLVHEPLAVTLQLVGTGGARGHQREVGIHAAVPAAIPLNAVAGVVISRMGQH